MRPVTLSMQVQVEEHSEHDDVTGEMTFEPFDKKCHHILRL